MTCASAVKFRFLSLVVASPHKTRLNFFLQPRAIQCMTPPPSTTKS
jgi:hypothetical protein